MALREAEQIARKRGDVRHFMHEPGMICNFVIYCLAFVAHVRIKRVTRHRCTHSVIEREAADALVDLRTIASGLGISRGSFRFFRVTDTGLIEIERDRSVMPEKVRPVNPVVPATAGLVTASPAPVAPTGFSVGTDVQEKGKGGG